MTTIEINVDPPPVVEVVLSNPPTVEVIALPGPPGVQGPQGDPGVNGTDGSTTRVVLLVIPGGYGPEDDSAIQEPITSSGIPTANAPPVTYYQNVYDPDTDQYWFWKFPIPGDYDSGGTLRLTWSTKGTHAGVVVWKGATAIGVIGTTDFDTAVFNTVTIVSDVPSVSEGILAQTLLGLTMTNAAANRSIVVMVGRDADNVLDVNTDFAVLLEATFEYERA